MHGLGKRSASLWALFASEYLPYRIINVTIYLAVDLLSTYPKMSNVASLLPLLPQLLPLLPQWLPLLSQFPHYSLSIPSITHSQFPQLRLCIFPRRSTPSNGQYGCVCAWLNNYAVYQLRCLHRTRSALATTWQLWFLLTEGLCFMCRVRFKACW